MKAKNFEILAAVEGVNALVASRGIPARPAFRVMRLARALEPLAEDIRKTQQKTAERYAEKDADGKPMTETVAGQEVYKLNGNTDKLNAEIQTLMTDEIDVAAEPLTADIFDGAEPPEDWTMLKILFALGPFVVEDAAE